MAIQDEGFEPLPAQVEPPEAGEELRLQDALAQGGGGVTLSVEAPAPIGRAPAYDFHNRRLIPDAAGGPLMTRGSETLAVWVEKCLRTRRGENPAVDPSFGLDLTAEDILAEGEPFDDASTAEYLAGVERALLLHPRITAVTDLAVDTDPDDDAVFITLRVAIDGDDRDPLTIELPVGG